MGLRPKKRLGLGNGWVIGVIRNGLWALRLRAGNGDFLWSSLVGLFLVGQFQGVFPRGLLNYQTVG